MFDHVNDGAVNTPSLFPAGVNQLVMAALIVKDGLGLDGVLRRVEGGVLTDNPLHDIAIFLYSIHRRIAP